MWSRVVEVMLGLWLILSVFIFRHPTSEWSWWATDLTCGLLVMCLSLCCFHWPLRWMHWLLIPVALWLVGFGYFGEPYPTPPALQNDLFVGLLLGMFALIPSHSNTPPDGWAEMTEDYHAKQGRAFSGKSPGSPIS